MTDVSGTVHRSPIIRVATDIGASHSDRVYAAARDATGSVPVVRTGPTGIVELEPLLLATVGGRTAFFIRLPRRRLANSRPSWTRADCRSTAPM